MANAMTPLNQVLTQERIDRLKQKVASGLGSDVPEPCPYCFGTGVEVAPDTELAPAMSKTTLTLVEQRGAGARRCRCQPDPRIVSSLIVIPERYRHVTLADLTPDLRRHPAQVKVVTDLKTHPGSNFFLCGRPDAGKTHFFWALYHHAAINARLVFASKLYALIEAIKTQMFDSSRPSPLPNLEGERVSIFIDDVNKARPTEFVAERLFNFLDDAYNGKHQLVVTSQLPPEGLARYFDTAGSNGVKTVDGAALVRRMANEETYIERML